ncbi:LEF7 [Hyphantria cunea nucleopolyhedrovirus]|uniref:LEF7 n=1 Tax=Hyphantria cunea nuclear polyhedrosis virus TaxID=28288 RepID=Q2NNV8_NPVHC|nr:LEF7 [Hyphantria cunea nucleopolyhedrovirus]BAE72320.1 LEF7 [Hyphantria cunea nucleopolyhedrovirus]
MEPPNKRCKLCYQALPMVPQLPLVALNKILSYLPFELHMAVAGANASTRRRALQLPHDRLALYFKHDIGTNDEFAAHWAIEVDDPAIAYVSQLCRFSCAIKAQKFFNKCVPNATARCMLNEPRAASDTMLSLRWGWWRLVRALIQHECKNGRSRRPERVRVYGDEICDVTIFDASLLEFDAQPDSIIIVTFDNDDNIQLYVHGKRVYRIVDKRFWN